jgi:transcriptional regulator with XRE-family HTH domain
MAKLLGISRATYNDYETNPQNVKIETYEKIANALGCDLVSFFKENNVTQSDITLKQKDNSKE